MVRDLPPPPELQQMQRKGPVALFVDFDGTLVELAPTPDSIVVPSGLADDVGSLAGMLDGRFALVSGRSIADLSRHLGSIDVCIAGSHGAEIRLPGDTDRAGAEHPMRPADLASVRAFAGAIPGLLVEHKPAGIALHYRNAPTRADEVHAFAAQLSEGRGWDLKHGKFVIEIVPAGVHKGRAVDLLMQDEPFRGAVPVFVGDDLTDEDGFAAVLRHGGHAVAVGERPSQLAGYRLPDPAAVREWLFAG